MRLIAKTQNRAYYWLALLLSIWFAVSRPTFAVVDTANLRLLDSGQVSLERNGGFSNRRTRTITDRYTITNQSDQVLVGPLTIEVLISPAGGATLINANDSTTDGAPIITLNIDSLAIGAQVNYELVFGNARRFTFQQNIFHPLPSDADQDGVPDNQDQCPDTPAGVPVDSDGCEIIQDTTPPELNIISPMSNVLVQQARPNIKINYSDNNSGVDATTLVFSSNEQTFTADCIFDLTEADCTPAVDLPEGDIELSASISDFAGNVVAAQTQFVIDIPVAVNFDTPVDDFITTAESILVSGTVGSNVETVMINSVDTMLNNGRFTSTIPLHEGKNVLVVLAMTATGESGSDTIQVTRDNTPPAITIAAPSAGQTLLTDTVAVIGSVNDIISGSVIDQAVSVTVNGIIANISGQNYLVENVPLQNGANTITAVARDAVGNMASANVSIFFETTNEQKIELLTGQGQTANIGSRLQDPLKIKLIDTLGLPVSGSNVIFRVIQGDGALDAFDGNESRAAVTVTDAQGEASILFRLGSRAGQGNHRVRASAVGFAGEVIFHASAEPNPGDKINVLSGDRQRGAVNRALPLPLVAAVTDSGSNLIADANVQFEVVAGGGKFENGQTVFTTTTNARGRASAQLLLGSETGLAAQRVVATLVGSTAFAGFTASAFIPSAVEQTTISGVVLDNQDKPVPGVTLRLSDTTITAISDVEGQFQLFNVPVGTVTLIADGSTAEVVGDWPTLSFDLITVAGVDNALPAPIYILPLNTAGAMTVGEQDAEYTLPTIPGFKLTVKAGSVTFPDGTKTGEISVTTVNTNKVPMPPPNGMQPQFIITIQPAGAIFDPPAPMTLPNVDGHPPGAQVEMYSFDHDLEEFVTIGLGTVSNDGSVIESNPGVGVIKAGWHCGSAPGGTGCTHNCPTCSVCMEPACVCEAIPDCNPCQGADCDGCNGPDCETCNGSGCDDCKGPNCVTCSGSDCNNCDGPDCQTCSGPDCNNCNGPDCQTCMGMDCAECTGPNCNTCTGADCDGCNGPDCTTCMGADCPNCVGPDCQSCSGSNCQSPCMGLDCDSDGDGRADNEDSNPDDPNQCGDSNLDGCDDCSNELCNQCAMNGICDDGNQCTLDSCQGDQCISEPTPSVPCDDSDMCTTDDICNGDMCQGRPRLPDLRRQADQLHQAGEALRERALDLSLQTIPLAKNTIENAKGVIDDGLSIIEGVSKLRGDVLACSTVVGCFRLIERIKDLDGSFKGFFQNLIDTRTNILDAITNLRNARLSWVIARTKFFDERLVRFQILRCTDNPADIAALQLAQSRIDEADQEIAEIDGLIAELNALLDQLGGIERSLESELDELALDVSCKNPENVRCGGVEFGFVCNNFSIQEELVCDNELNVCTSYVCLDSGEPVACVNPQFNTVQICN